MTHFGVGTAELLGAMSEAVAPADSPVVGVDWRTSLTDAAARVAPGTALQGNLDPVVLLAGFPVAERAARVVVEDGRRAVDAGAGGPRLQLGPRCAPGNRPGCHHRDRGIGALAVTAIVLRCRRRDFGARRRVPAAGHPRRRRGHHGVRARRSARRRAAHRTGRRPANRCRCGSVRRPAPRGACVADRAGPGRKADRHDGRAAADLQPGRPARAAPRHPKRHSCRSVFGGRPGGRDDDAADA